MKLIGLAGPPGAGKETIGAYLARSGFIRWSFGEPIPGHEYLRATLALRCIQPLRNNDAAGAVVELESDEDAALIREQGGQVWLIQRPGYLTRAGSPYKGIAPRDTDRGLLNDGPLVALYDRVDELLGELEANGAAA